MVPGWVCIGRRNITHTHIQLEQKKERMMKRDTFISLSLSPFELLIHLLTSVVLSRASSVLLKFYIYTHLSVDLALSSYYYNHF